MAVHHATRTVCALAVLVSACSIQRGQPSAKDDHISHMSAADVALPRAMSGGEVSLSQGTPGLPASNSTAAARLSASPRHAEWVKIAWEPGSKDSLMAWIVYPATTRAKTPVVVVVHEIFGLSTWVRGVADQVAADGFIAIAPDLLSRVRGGPTADELRGDSATKLIRGVDFTERNKGITAVANYAMSQPSAAQKYGVIGYCWGGSTTWGAAVANGKGFGGGVAFYGLPYMNGAVPIADSMAKITQPVMLLSGSKDARIGSAMPAVDSTMKALGKWYSGTNYDGAIHGFLRAQDDPKPASTQCDEACVAKERADNLAATKDAWPKTVTFLKRNLGLK
ncbi:MAG: dienelactone hydrolase [Gemmatimonadetes bacterium]|jgi:carboxymethylenebutenolidase|nr:dienelactone hydrolase [Gemmatimonadota bacterium]